MTKPWEETWSFSDGLVKVPDDDRDGFFGEKSSWGGSCPCIALEALERDEDRMRLAAAAPEMVRLLLANEWGGETQCLSCGNWEHKHGVHKPACPWLVVMQRAGIR